MEFDESNIKQNNLQFFQLEILSFELNVKMMKDILEIDLNQVQKLIRFQEEEVLYLKILLL